MPEGLDVGHPGAELDRALLHPGGPGLGHEEVVHALGRGEAQPAHERVGDARGGRGHFLEAVDLHRHGAGGLFPRRGHDHDLPERRQRHAVDALSPRRPPDLGADELRGRGGIRRGYAPRLPEVAAEGLVGAGAGARRREEGHDPQREEARPLSTPSPEDARPPCHGPLPRRLAAPHTMEARRPTPPRSSAVGEQTPRDSQRGALQSGTLREGGDGPAGRPPRRTRGPHGPRPLGPRRAACAPVDEGAASPRRRGPRGDRARGVDRQRRVADRPDRLRQVRDVAPLGDDGRRHPADDPEHGGDPVHALHGRARLHRLHAHPAPLDVLGVDVHGPLPPPVRVAGVGGRLGRSLLLSLRGSPGDARRRHGRVRDGGGCLPGLRPPPRVQRPAHRADARDLQLGDGGRDPGRPRGARRALRRPARVALGGRGLRRVRPRRPGLPLRARGGRTGFSSAPSPPTPAAGAR